MSPMKFQPLWYVRRGDRVSGPFPEKWIRRDLALGRLAPEDEISPDRLTWVPLSERRDWLAAPPPTAPADLPEWEEERRQARLRWMDERRLPDRRRPHGDHDDAHDQRRGDRRQPESAQALLARQHHQEVEAALRVRRERFAGVILALLLVLAALAWALWRLPPVEPVAVRLPAATPDCRAPATPQVNWRGCDKSGVWLRGVNLESAMLANTRFNSAHLALARLTYANLAGADLSFANLDGAVLEAANLQGANLAYADLKQADLRRADLRGARLEAADLTGARLGFALWTDGRTCAPESVGFCQ